MNPYDILIVGGGLVGASLVRALQGRGLRIAVVEAVQFETRIEAGYDDRAIALAHGTQRIFSSLGFWNDLADDATPIHRIHVSDRGTAVLPAWNGGGGIGRWAMSSWPVLGQVLAMSRLPRGGPIVPRPSRN
jgi:2-polyprenyl-6-methoxyphenol hydroxylase-like FAD-dependent oxidoreductase